MRDPFELWLNQICESEGTYEEHMCVMSVFEEWIRSNYGLDAREIPASWREAKYQGIVPRERILDQLNDVLKDYFAHLKGGYAPLTVNHMMATAVSYLHCFDIPVKPLSLRYAWVKYHNRDITKEEIRLILDHSDVRNRAIYLLLYESGMRPITLVKLRYRHIKDEFLAHKIPMKIDLPAEILKCRVRTRWTFIGQDGYEALKRYLVTRLPLKEEDYVFVREKPKGGKVGSGAVSQAFSAVVKKLELAEPRGPNGRKPKEIRLYCLKKAFKKFHQADEDYKKFWMGRTETSTHYVSEDPEHHRRLYAEGYENLQLYRPKMDTETAAKLARENMELKVRVDRLESALGDIADLKAQIKQLNLEE